MLISAVTLLVLSMLPPEKILVSTEELAAMPEVLVVDARNAEAFAAGHVPGAAHLDVETLSETREGVVGLLKHPADLTKLLEAAGLDPKRHLVVCSGMKDAGDVTRATRLFWILEQMSYPQVSLLNGGFAKWAAEGRAVETGASTVAPVSGLVLNPKPELLATREDVVGIVEDGSSALVDCRSAEEYAGLSKKDFVSEAGHIPSAQSLPSTELVEGPYFEFKTGDALMETLGTVETEPGKEVVTYCNSGRSASVGYLGYRLGGFKKIRLYDGSMAEWSHHPGLKVEADK